MIEIRLLGPVEVWADGRRLDAWPPQRRTVLAALAAEGGRPVPAGAIVDRVWGQAPPAQVRSAVHANVSLIRRVLRELSTVGDQRPPVRVARRASGYALEIDPQWVDLHRFRGLASAARHGQCPDTRRAALLRDALDLWRGTPLADLNGEWAERMRTSWWMERLDAAVDWARAEARLRHHDAVVSRVRTLVAEYPLAEPLVAALLRALAATGRVAEALECYATTRVHLRSVLGIEPGIELRELHRAMVRQDTGPDRHTGRR